MDREAIIKSVAEKLILDRVLKDIPYLKSKPIKLFNMFKDLEKEGHSQDLMKDIFKEIEKKGHLNNINKTTWEPIYEMFKVQCPIIEDILKKE